ncbi:MAG: ABC transporter ATP-binding protein [Oscillospiraceae bacterium]|nr:ABC transporter ATP-binding protein [Oscillospiraceae bacterium]
MLKRLWPHARPYSKWIALGVLCSAAEAIFELLIPLVMSDIVDIGIANADQDYILRKGIQMVIMAMVSLAMGLSSAACSSIAGQGFGANLRSAQYEHIQDYAFSNIEKFSTASLVTRLTSDVNSMQLTLMMGMRLLVRAPVMLVSALFLSVTISYKLSNVFLVALPLLIVAVALILSKASPLFRSLQEKTDALNLVVQENLTGIRVVKSFVREDHERKKFAKRNLDLKNTSQKAFGMVVINMPVMMLIVYGTIIAVMWFGGQMVYAGTLEAGKLLTYFTYITQIMMSLMMVSMIFMMMSRSVACARRIVEVLDERPAITDDEAKREPDAEGHMVPAEVKNGAIDFDHVSFKYDLSSPEWILDDICLHIASGQTVGILGGTGSAKTTLVSLIPRLYEATEGTVSVGGRPVKDYTMEHLRDAVSVVLQKNTLFSGTIRENLLWGNPNATDEQLWEACRAACADEFLERMPDGLDTDLGQGGVNVSGGQKQRLCIARAILKQPKVLILDDSTSAVDTATDAKIRQAFANELKDTTKIIIAQRVTSICEADLILVMDRGRIIAQGNHQELMEHCDMYREVYQSQQEGVSIGG